MKLLPLLIAFFSLSVHAERLTTKIHSVERSPDKHKPHFVRFENGRVGFIRNSDKSTMEAILASKKEWLEVELDSKSNLKGASVVAAPKGMDESVTELKSRVTYEPTNLATLDQATTAFRKMRTDWQRWSGSQCYNRAHVWSYEEFQRTGLKSMKLFMFFTRSYIWKYNYKWWFHVTPMTYVAGVPMTMDRMFMKGPAEVKTWSDKFIISKRNCPVIYRYTDYSQHQDTEHCYLHPASMYFWQPRDLERLEQTGFEKTQFVRSDINWAYDEAF
jgi:hypothetical protein